jgi:hypothetical protein
MEHNAQIVPDGLTDKQRRFLEIRRRGRARYVWYFGVLRFGGVFTLLMALMWYALLPGYHPPLIPNALPRFIALLLYMAPFAALGGFVYGHWMWRIFERNTRQLGNDAGGGSAPA